MNAVERELRDFLRSIVHEDPSIWDALVESRSIGMSGASYAAFRAYLDTALGVIEAMHRDGEISFYAGRPDHVLGLDEAKEDIYAHFMTRQ